MKKLTASIFATLLTVVSVGAANANIASQGYVDDQVKTINANVATKADASTVTALTERVGTNEGNITDLQETVATKADTSTVTALEQTVTTNAAAAEKIANRVSTVSESSSDTTYPSAKAVWDVVTAKTTGIASDEALTALEGRVSTAEGDITALEGTVATKADKSTSLAGYGITDAYTKGEVDSALSEKQATLTTEQQNAVNSGITKEKVTTYDGYAAQIAAKANTDDLGALATMDAVGSAEITDGSITSADISATAAIKETQLDTAVQTSLGLADTSVQPAQIADMETKTYAAATYETKANASATYATKDEIANMATEENLTLKQDKTDNSLATTQKTIVGAINEVNTAATDAADAADAAQSAADAAQEDATQALSDAADAQVTANAAIPKVNAAGSDGVYVLTATAVNGTATYQWELIQRGSAE